MYYVDEWVPEIKLLRRSAGLYYLRKEAKRTLCNTTRVTCNILGNNQTGHGVAGGLSPFHGRCVPLPVCNTAESSVNTLAAHHICSMRLHSCQSWGTSKQGGTVANNVEKLVNKSIELSIVCYATLQILLPNTCAYWLWCTSVAHFLFSL